MQDFINAIKTDRLQDAVDLLLKFIKAAGINLKEEEQQQYSNILLVLSSNIARIDQDTITGVITYQEADSIKNRIIKSLLRISNAIENKSKNKEKIEIINSENESLLDNLYAKLEKYLEHQIKFKLVLSDAIDDVSILLPSNKFTAIYQVFENIDIDFSLSEIEKKQNISDKNDKEIILNTFTQRDLELLMLICSGKTSREQANELGVAMITYRLHCRHIVTKFMRAFKCRYDLNSINGIAEFVLATI